VAVVNVCVPSVVIHRIDRVAMVRRPSSLRCELSIARYLFRSHALLDSNRVKWHMVSKPKAPRTNRNRNPDRETITVHSKQSFLNRLHDLEEVLVERDSLQYGDGIEKNGDKRVCVGRGGRCGQTPWHFGRNCNSSQRQPCQHQRRRGRVERKGREEG
jgi:hypothetical protein